MKVFEGTERTEEILVADYNIVIDHVTAIGACEELMARVRMFKTDREIETLRRAFVNTEKALLSTLVNIHEGETEIMMANRLADNMMHAGADQTNFYHINAGPNTGFPHKPQSSYQVLELWRQYRQQYQNRGAHRHHRGDPVHAGRVRGIQAELSRQERDAQ